VPAFGLVGAAVATALSELIRLWLAARAAGRAGYPAVAVRQLWAPTAAALAMATVMLLVRPTALWTSIPLGAVVYAAAIFVTMRGSLLRRQA
jgi:hypothetical protein